MGRFRDVITYPCLIETTYVKSLKPRWRSVGNDVNVKYNRVLSQLKTGVFNEVSTVSLSDSHAVGQ